MSLIIPHILIIDEIHPCFFEQVGMANFKISYLPEIDAGHVAEAMKDVDVLIVRSKVFVDEKLCKQANKLKVIARAGSGLDNLDTAWLDENNIAYLNTPEANSQAVAEQTLGMLLSLLANIVKGDREVRDFIWDREGNRGDELEGKTIGIIGFGNTGSRFAKILQGFDVEILAYDKYKSGYGNGKVKEVEMNNIFEKADIVSLHIPLTSETKQLVNHDFTMKFTKPFYLLNLSRGRIVNTADVLDSLDTGKIIGFAADVLENERINQLNNSESTRFKSLCSKGNVVLTPHIGGWTHQSYQRISVSLALKIQAFFNPTFTVEKGFKEAQKFP